MGELPTQSFILLFFSVILSSTFILLSGCSHIPVGEQINPPASPFIKGGLGGITHQNLNAQSKQELVADVKELWGKYHYTTIGNEAINCEFGKWDDFVKEIIKSDYGSNGGKSSVSLVRRINKDPIKAKEGGYYDDYENKIVIPFKVTFTAEELKEALRYALLDTKLETLSKIQKTRSAKVLSEYKILHERINPEHVDMFGDNFNKFSEDELRALITCMNEKRRDEAASIEYNLRFFQDALDHELGHFFLDDVEEGGLGLLYDKRYEGPAADEILDYAYKRFEGSPFFNRLSEIYAPVTWCHKLEGHNPPHPPFTKGGIGGIKELIEYILKQRASYRLYVVANYDNKGIAWHVGTLCFLGVDEDEIPLSLTLPLEGGGKGGGELPHYFIPYNGQIFFNPVRKEIVSVGAGLPHPYKMAEIRQAEVYLREYEAVLLKHELFVRMVDALMSVSLKDNSEERDFSNTNYDLKPLLNEADLKMFERMKFAWKPMFQKAIEKYRLGLQLLKNGYSPEEVRKELEYATYYIYKGKEYFWQNNGFNITGEIPLSDGIEVDNEVLPR